jgi:NAD(P)-dependent dehydrogenase (short-subunit alcohol dehydrogenase family)
MPESVDPRHLLLIGAGPGVGAGVVRRFGREGFRSTLISRRGALEQLAPELRSGGLEIEAVSADIEDLDAYRATLERIFGAPGAPGVTVYNAASPDPGAILDTTVGRLRTAHDVDVLGAVVAAQVAAPTAALPTIRCPGGGGSHAATVTIAGQVAPGTAFDLDTRCDRYSLGTAPHAIHQPFSGYTVARQDLLVALEVDRVGQLTQQLLDELVRVPSTAQDPRGFLVRPACRRAAHIPSIRSSSAGLG